MPDWSYHTLLKPAFFRLPDDASRRFVVGFFERLSALPAGPKLIDALGHMRPHEQLGRELGGLSFPSPTGLSPMIDPEGRALKAFSRFGFGWITVGPVAAGDPGATPRFERSRDGQGVIRQGALGLAPQALEELDRRGTGAVQLGCELTAGSTADVAQWIERLADRVDFFLLSPASFPASGASEAWLDSVSTWAKVAAEVQRPLWLGLPVDAQITPAWLDDVVSRGIAGLSLSGRPVPDHPDQWRWHQDDHPIALQSLTRIRRSHPDLTLMVDGGILSPRDALETLEAGADLVAVGIGLVHTGPGLPKRINEAIEYEIGGAAKASSPSPPPERQAWFWGAALGLAMGIGAALAVWISLTDVLLPYDESFLGKTRAMIEAFNPRILQFMTHDRITLAGTMLSLSFTYLALSLFGTRLGHHWAQRAVTVSAGVGFITFFSFLGFGYLDPFHAFVAVILFQLFIQTLVLPLGVQKRTLNPPHLDNDQSWRWAQWGQLVFVSQSAGLMAAGTVILAIGMTSIFVPTDLDFLRMLPQAFHAFDPQLMPLIAHDRATFGGMLLSGGLALLLTTLWSFRGGDGWLWWTYFLVLLPPYAMTLWIHFHIGYTAFIHLLPIYVGLLFLIAGLLLSARYLLRSGQRVPRSVPKARY